jgi:hypothetical protein
MAETEDEKLARESRSGGVQVAPVETGIVKPVTQQESSPTGGFTQNEWQPSGTGKNVFVPAQEGRMMSGSQLPSLGQIKPGGGYVALSDQPASPVSPEVPADRSYRLEPIGGGAEILTNRPAAEFQNIRDRLSVSAPVGEPASLTANKAAYADAERSAKDARDAFLGREARPALVVKPIIPRTEARTPTEESLINQQKPKTRTFGELADEFSSALRSWWDNR